MTSYRKTGLGTSELFIGIAISMMGALLIGKYLSEQREKLQIAELKTQMTYINSRSMQLSQKFEMLSWDTLIDSNTALQACFKGQGSACDTQFSSETVLQLLASASGTYFNSQDNQSLNAFYTESGSPCGTTLTVPTTMCPLQQRTTVRYECADQVCHRGIITTETKIHKTVLVGNKTSLYASIAELKGEISHERVKQTGIIRTLASSCSVSDRLSVGTGVFGCAVNAVDEQNDFFNNLLGQRMTNASLVLTSTSGTLTLGSGTSSSVSSAISSSMSSTTSSVSSSNSSTSSSNTVVNNCPPSTVAEMDGNGALICKTISLRVCTFPPATQCINDSQQVFNAVTATLAPYLSSPGNINIAAGELPPATALQMTQNNYLTYYSSYTKDQSWSDVSTILNIPPTSTVLWSQASPHYSNTAHGGSHRDVYAYLIEDVSKKKTLYSYATEYLTTSGWRKNYVVGKDYTPQSCKSSCDHTPTPPPPVVSLPPVNGVCGSTHNTVVSSVPTANLCTTGTASAVSGANPWSWNCAGANGGSSATCATRACQNACGQALCPGASFFYVYGGMFAGECGFSDSANSVLGGVYTSCPYHSNEMYYSIQNSTVCASGSHQFITSGDTGAGGSYGVFVCN